MSLRINTNVDALTAYRNLSNTQASMSTSLERLSSGLRINKAADDAAGLAISQGLTAQINGIGQAVRNAQDGINVVQTADGALTETQSILQRMNTLAVQAANDSNDSNSRGAIQTEITALNSELDRISSSTAFNGVKVLDGSFANKVFQVGATNAAYDQIGVNITSGAAVGAAVTIGGSTPFSVTAAGATGDTLTVAYGGTSVSVDASSLTTTSKASDVADLLNKDAGFSKSFTASADKDGNLLVQAKSYDGTYSDTVSVAAVKGGSGTLAIAGTVVDHDAYDPSHATVDFKVPAGYDPANTTTLNFTDGSGTTPVTADISKATSGSAQDIADELNNATDNAGFASAYHASVDATTGDLVITAKDAGTKFSVSDRSNSPSAFWSTGTAHTSTGGFDSDSLGTASLDLTTQKGAEAAIQSIQASIRQVSTARANLGALQNRFQHTINNLNVTQQNLQASNSSITDTDMASEMSNFTRAQILSQAGTSMLKQANQASQSVLSLLQ